MSDAPRSFAIVTDSTADISPELAAANGITVVPLSVSFGADSMRDGDLDQETYFARMNASADLPTTSQPPMGDFVNAYEKLLETYDHVVSVHISNKLSGTIESARQAAQNFGDRVHIFDSLNLSWGLAFQVFEAVEAAAQNVSVPDAIKRLEALRPHVGQSIGIDGLENLRKGGRVSRLSAVVGGLLNVKVDFKVTEVGELVPMARFRGEKAAIRGTLDWVAERMGDATRGRFAVGYALYEERAHAIADMIRERWDVTQMEIYPTGIVIATHTGTGWGVAVRPE